MHLSPLSLTSSLSLYWITPFCMQMCSGFFYWKTKKSFLISYFNLIKALFLCSPRQQIFLKESGANVSASLGLICPAFSSTFWTLPSSSLPQITTGAAAARPRGLISLLCSPGLSAGMNILSLLKHVSSHQLPWYPLSYFSYATVSFAQTLHAESKWDSFTMLPF